MKLALMSDLHANLQALTACLEHARTHGAQGYAFLGDLVGYGGDPATVVDLVMALADEGARVVQGNHDALALNPPAVPHTLGEHGALWTHQQLGPEARQFLQHLPLIQTVDSALLVHASADGPSRWRYVDSERAAQASLEVACAQPGIRHVFCGHVHQQSLYYRGAGGGIMRFAPQPGVGIPVSPHRQWLATVGSVGQPRDGDPRAMYAVFDTSAHVLTFYRVDYAYEVAADAIRATHALPEHFAQRLARGH